MPSSMMPEPEGFSILAARLLLREIGDKPLDQEMLAVLLDEVLHYGWAVRLLMIEASDPYAGHDRGDFFQNILEFERWAQKALLGYPTGSDSEGITHD